MTNLKRNYNRFVFKHRNKGIPRLMLWICVSNAVVFVLWRFFGLDLPSLLNFDSQAILRGQVWRLFTYAFTFSCESGFLGSSLLGAVISILFYYWVGNILENTWGTLRFNLYYLTGILLADLYALLLTLIFGYGVSLGAHHLNLSMFLAVATLIPEQRVYLYMIIPVKMKWLAWVYFVLTLYPVFRNIPAVIEVWQVFGAFYGIGTICMILLPLVALLNYLIFFGRGIRNVLPSWMVRRKVRPKAVPFRHAAPGREAAAAKKSEGQSYRHKCTVCGRTDRDCPDLEFRYCSRCKGYFCYCIDHINNHNHVQ